MAIQDKFHNFKNKSKEFDTFNGTEIKLFIKVPTRYDTYGRIDKFELVELGTASAYSWKQTYAAEPVVAIGYKYARGVARGSKLISGSIVFEVLNKGFVGEIRQILKDAGVQYAELGFNQQPNGSYIPNYEFGEINSVNDLPNMDIVILGVKETNQNKKIQHIISGMRFASGSSGVGIDQLSVREQYSWLAKDMSDYEPVTGTEEQTEDQPEYYSWGI
jgi:hypothetical protein